MKRQITYLRRGPLRRHRGSGASKGRGRSVRENTVLSFQKAATSMVDFIEFDVHVTAVRRALLSAIIQQLGTSFQLVQSLSISAGVTTSCMLKHAHCFSADEALDL